MRRLILISSMMFFVVGCVSRSTQCKYPIERDLTVSWEERQYWCAPSQYKNAVIQKPQVQVEKTPSFKSPSRLNSSNVVASGNWSIKFFQHDNQYSKDDLQNVLTANKNLKLRGCRLNTENQQLNFSRALRVRDELKRLGFNHKLTILADNSCLGSQSVQIR